MSTPYRGFPVVATVVENIALNIGPQPATHQRENIDDVELITKKMDGVVIDDDGDVVMEPFDDVRIKHDDHVTVIEDKERSTTVPASQSQPAATAKTEKPQPAIIKYKASFKILAESSIPLTPPALPPSFLSSSSKDKKSSAQGTSWINLAMSMGLLTLPHSTEETSRTLQSTISTNQNSPNRPVEKDPLEEMLEQIFGFESNSCLTSVGSLPSLTKDTTLPTVSNTATTVTTLPQTRFTQEASVVYEISASLHQNISAIPSDMSPSESSVPTALSTEDGSQRFPSLLKFPDTKTIFDFPGMYLSCIKLMSKRAQTQLDRLCQMRDNSAKTLDLIDHIVKLNTDTINMTLEVENSETGKINYYNGKTNDKTKKSRKRRIEATTKDNSSDMDVDSEENNTIVANANCADDVSDQPKRKKMRGSSKCRTA